MRVRVGTSGYSYKEWKGSFYPEDLPATKMLSFYAERFDTVEINNTFYRMPDAGMLSKWSAEDLATVADRAGKLERSLMFTAAPDRQALGEELLAIARKARSL